MKATVLFDGSCPVGIYLSPENLEGGRVVTTWSPLFNNALQVGPGIAWELGLDTRLFLDPASDCGWEGWRVSYETTYVVSCWELHYSTLTEALDAISGLVKVE